MRITFQQGKGRYNKDYWTSILWFDEADKHVFLRKEKSKSNIMFKHNEISMILKSLLEVEPLDKRKKLKKLWIEAIEEGFQSETKYNK